MKELEFDEFSAPLEETLEGISKNCFVINKGLTDTLHAAFKKEAAGKRKKTAAAKKGTEPSGKDTDVAADASEAEPVAEVSEGEDSAAKRVKSSKDTE